METGLNWGIQLVSSLPWNLFRGKEGNVRTTNLLHKENSHTVKVYVAQKITFR